MHQLLILKVVKAFRVDHVQFAASTVAKVSIGKTMRSMWTPDGASLVLFLLAPYSRTRPFCQLTLFR